MVFDESQLQHRMFLLGDYLTIKEATCDGRGRRDRVAARRAAAPDADQSNNSNLNDYNLADPSEPAIITSKYYLLQFTYTYSAFNLKFKSVSVYCSTI